MNTVAEMMSMAADILVNFTGRPGFAATDHDTCFISLYPYCCNQLHPHFIHTTKFNVISTKIKRLSQWINYRAQSY